MWAREIGSKREWEQERMGARENGSKRVWKQERMRAKESKNKIRENGCQREKE